MRFEVFIVSVKILSCGMWHRVD